MRVLDASRRGSNGSSSRDASLPRGFAITMQLVLAIGTAGELSLPATVVID